MNYEYLQKLPISQNILDQPEPCQPVSVECRDSERTGKAGNNNLKNHRPDIVARLLNQLDAWEEQMKAPAWPGVMEYEEEINGIKMGLAPLIVLYGTWILQVNLFFIIKYLSGKAYFRSEYQMDEIWTGFSSLVLPARLDQS